MLLRFVHALAGTGARVMVPEIPEWRELFLAPEEAEATIKASVLSMRESGTESVGKVGVMGFSLGVAQVLLAATRAELATHIQGVAGFGGYATLDRTTRFLFHGEHEWQGKTHLADPDPYGRWVVGGNFLTLVPGYENAGDVAEALLNLARQAGDLQVAAWEAQYDSIKAELQETVHPSRQTLFRAFAPPTGHQPPRETTEELAPALARAGLARFPEYDPVSFVDRISVPVRLVHGRGDRLIPFSESLRLAQAFPQDADLRVYLTGLFAHSQKGRRADRGLLERLRFMRIMSDLLTLT
jgi:dienelactone hydrolase